MLQNKSGIKPGVADKALSTRSPGPEDSVPASKRAGRRKGNNVGQARPAQRSSSKSPAAKKRQATTVPSSSRLELENRLKMEEADAELRRWKDRALVRAFLVVAFGLCVVWGVVFLSGRFSPEDKRWVTDVFGNLVYGLVCFMAGKNIKGGG